MQLHFYLTSVCICQNNRNPSDVGDLSSPNAAHPIFCSSVLAMHAEIYCYLLDGQFMSHYRVFSDVCTFISNLNLDAVNHR